jgi:hypothetical protein
VRFLWIFGNNQIRTSRDPGAFTYGRGDHRIEMRVIDGAGNFSRLYYLIHVLGPRPRDTGDQQKSRKNTPNTPSTPKKSPKSIKKEDPSSSQKRVKKKNMGLKFFDPPSIVIQDKKYISSGSVYTWLTTTRSCGLNLTLS